MTLSMVTVEAQANTSIWHLPIQEKQPSGRMYLVKATIGHLTISTIVIA